MRTSVEPARLIETVRRELEVLEPNLLVDELWTMQYRLAKWRSAERLAAALLGGFAGLALVLATVGVYGVIAHSVAARRREIGIRMALGAARGDIVGLVLRRGLGLTAAGVALGSFLSVAGVRLLASQLYGTDPYGPATWLAAIVAVTVGALSACALPAWRAGRFQPAAVLHWE